MEHLIQYSKLIWHKARRVVNLEASTPLCSSKQKTQKANGDLRGRLLSFGFVINAKKAGMCYD